MTALVPMPGDAALPAGAPPGIELVPYRLEGTAGRIAAVGRVLLSGQPFQNALFASRDLAGKLALLAPRHDLVWLQLVRLAPFAAAAGATPAVVDLIDSLALNFERRAARDRSWLCPLWRWEAKRLARAEASAVASARAALVVCERDRRHLAARLPPELAGRVQVLPLIQAPAPAPAATSDHEPGRLIFTGNLGYFPNADAARCLLIDLWPAIQRASPSARLTLAGDRPGRALRRLATTAGAELEASPADLAARLARAAISLAPLRAGSGTPIKVLEAWAAGVPVVASPWAAAGTTAEPGRDLLVAETPAEWAEAVRRLLEDPALANRLAEAGREHLRADYGAGVVRGRLAEILR
ncbi:MAG TPA: glycosyltransferase family 4 protein [Thermoanaerobaculia bacterium]|nr:glycosyltransferase family 4 protein [Thermoanaerobaculia bacterium]